MAKTTTQTVRINGKRVRLVTRDGRVTVKAANEQEWVLQAAAVKRLKAMPEYDRDFTIAGDMNAGKRSMSESAKAKATGLAAGDPDLRVYMRGGRLGLIEYKGADGSLTPAQRARHPLLASLGHPVVVIKAATETECANATERQVRAWLADNDNRPTQDDYRFFEKGT